MSAWAVRSSGFRRILGAYNPQYGVAGSVFDLLRDDRYPGRVKVIGGVLEKDCRRLLDTAFLQML